MSFWLDRGLAGRIGCFLLGLGLYAGICSVALGATFGAESATQSINTSESSLVDSQNLADSEISESKPQQTSNQTPQQTLELSPLPSLDPNPKTYRDKIQNPQWGNAAKNEPPNPFSFPKDGSYYLEAYAPMLRDFVRQVREQSQKGDYPRYSSRPLIEYSVYKKLKNADRAVLRGGIVLVSGYLAEFIKYSNFGGVGVGMRQKPSDEKSFYLSFDGRYLTDLESFGLGKEIFAYCVLPRFDKCIMLGIGEEW